MTPIEQAREALTGEQIAKLITDLRCGASTSTDVGVHLRKYQALCDRAAEALAALSPTTPVDGVGAEPRVKPFYVIDIPINSEGKGPCSVHEATHISYEVWDHDTATHGRHRRLSDAIEQADKLNSAALASPEAEARLRERVAEAELKAAREEEISNTLVAWAIDNPNPGDPDVMVEAWRSALERADAAEARLAQAEGGPAVTEDMIRVANSAFFAAWSQPQGRVAAQSTITGVNFDYVMRAALEAALHPQSAAGEEGK